ncbi:MAG TPA: DUF6265 family protein [Woeseiaceae bacterium]
MVRSAPALMGLSLMRLALHVSLLAACMLSAGHAADTNIARLQWLAGCWASAADESGSGEQWMAPAGRSMLGVSRTIRGGRTVAYEFLRIAEDEDGQIIFIASPSGQAITTFNLLRMSDSEVVFENADHDFPQRVIYRKLAENGLLGRIEGTLNGEERRVDFPMQKADCGA